MSKLETKCKTPIVYHYSVVVVIALLLLSETRGLADDLDQATLLNLYERALANNSLSLYTLRKLYFNPLPYTYSSSLCLQVSVTVKDIRDPNGYCVLGAAAFDYDPGASRYSFGSYCQLQLLQDDGGESKLSEILSVSKSADIFYLFDPTFFSIMKTLAKSIETTDLKYNFEYNTDNQYHIGIDISGELEYMPCWEDAAYALQMLLVWAKSYARTGGIPQIRRDEDRISVKACYNDSTSIPGCPGNLDASPISAAWTWVLFVCILGSSYILVLSLVVVFIRRVFLWLQQQGKQTKLIYKASAIVLTVVNIITLASDFSFGVHSFDWTLTLISFLPGKVMFFVLAELPVAFGGTYNYDQKKYRPLHALAFWQIIIFVHRLVIDIIISVVFFILAPAQTVGVVTLLLSVIASAIAFLAIIINRRCAGDKQTFRFMFCATYSGILITGILVTITLLFIVLVDNGLQAAGVGGVLLSIIPPLTVFGIGIFVNKTSVRSTILSTFLGGARNTSGAEDVEAQPLIEPQNTTTKDGGESDDEIY